MLLIRSRGILSTRPITIRSSGPRPSGDSSRRFSRTETEKIVSAAREGGRGASRGLAASDVKVCTLDEMGSLRSVGAGPSQGEMKGGNAGGGLALADFTLLSSNTTNPHPHIPKRQPGLDRALLKCFPGLRWLAALKVLSPFSFFLPPPRQLWRRASGNLRCTPPDLTVGAN